MTNRRMTIRTKPPRRGRRGLSVIVIMGLISITLALSYTVLRTQMVQTQLSNNTTFNASASQAAMAGMSIGLRKMSESGWTLDTVVKGSMSSSQSYSVTYTTGDPSLSATDPDWPFRVTVLSTGTVQDLAHGTITSVYRIQAIVRLMPRQTYTNPTTFTSALPYTVYQYASDDFEIQPMGQVTGQVRLQGKLRLYDVYPPSNCGLNQYLGDLNAMLSNGYADYRPLNGPVFLPTNQSSGTTLSELGTQLGVTYTNISQTSASSWNSPSAIAAYQLYPGGRYYFTTALKSASQSNVTLAADPRNNPLGIFTYNGNLTLGNNVTVNGMLMVSNKLTISGTNVNLNAVSLPALTGTTKPVQLPAAVCGNDISVSSGATVNVQGMLVTWGQFDIVAGTQNTSFSMLGRMITKGFRIEERTEWNLWYWNFLWNWFNNQLNPPSSGTTYYYPVYLSYWSLPYTPALTVAPEASPVAYQWKDPNNPIYVVGLSDVGLRWTVVRWTNDV
jgi:hypothetical protein